METCIVFILAPDAWVTWGKPLTSVGFRWFLEFLPTHTKKGSTILEGIYFTDDSAVLIYLLSWIPRWIAKQSTDAFQKFHSNETLFCQLPYTIHVTMSPSQITVATPHPEGPDWTLPFNSPQWHAMLDLVRLSCTGSRSALGLRSFSLPLCHIWPRAMMTDH